MTIKSNIPATLVAGDSWAWSEATAYAEYPPADWSLTYILRPATGGTALSITATDGGGAFTLAALATTTATLAAGEYSFSVLASNSGTGARHVLASGRVCILPDPMTQTGDLRSANERTLAAIIATIEGRATKDADSYTIEGRSISRTPLADLLRLQAVYERRVARERNPSASPFHYRRISL
ncbi:hypothetical protein [Falsiruegeria litorea]|uniref:hypothetical protein n=1 Tax=Falsiruegeria litorea TaxID=1280831 RepID=UPI001BFDF4A2|nr:hypothetical protein [Falsiruegeria litorea]MBT8169881.1 hypothetical protein [Falsiruegeria litorea]